MKEIPIEIAGFEGRGLKIIDHGIFKPLEVFIDGAKLRMKGFKYLVRDNSGKDVDVKLIWSFPIEFCRVSVGGQVIKIKEPLKWYECLWSGWPLFMIFFGGAIGGALGAGAALINAQIFRGKANRALKYLYAFFISVAAFLIWAIVAAYLQQRYMAR